MAQASVDTPKRAWLKASEVCDLAKVQPYVLRTWELEFPNLGVVKTPGGPRMYRPSDVEQVRRIRELVFDQGLTLAGARRRLEEDRTVADTLPFEEPPADEPIALPRQTRSALTQIKRELRNLLDLLGGPPAGNGHAPAPATAKAAPSRSASKKAKPAGKPKSAARKRR